MGPFINDVTQFLDIFSPPSPFVMPLCPKSYALQSHFALPLSPSLHDVIYEWSLRQDYLWIRLDLFHCNKITVKKYDQSICVILLL